MKKTKIDRTNDKIAKEQLKKEGLIQKRDEIQAEIDACEDEIARLQKKLSQDKLEFIGKQAALSGLTIDDLLAAISNGDFYSIQDKVEKHEAKGTSRKSRITDIDSSLNEQSDEQSEPDDIVDEDTQDNDSDSDEIQDEITESDDEVSPDIY